MVEASARVEIAQAYLWLAERSPDDAERWFNRLYATIESLELFPERCPLAPESQFFNREIRQIFHGRRQHKYRILFAVSDRGVRVLHVRHGAWRALGDPEAGTQ